MVILANRLSRRNLFSHTPDLKNPTLNSSSIIRRDDDDLLITTYGSNMDCVTYQQNDVITHATFGMLYHPYPTWQQGQTSDIQIYGSGNTVGVTQGQGQSGGY